MDANISETAVKRVEGSAAERLSIALWMKDKKLEYARRLNNLAAEAEAIEQILDRYAPDATRHH